MISKLIVCTLLIFACLVTSGVTATPSLISYQGLLTDASGDPVPDASYSVRFTIYNQPYSGSMHWQEVKPISTVDGLFSTMLGSMEPLYDWVFAGESRYLGIKVGGDPEMTPRARLVSVPYSFRVSSIDSATGGTLTGGLVIQPTFARDSGDAVTVLRGDGEVSSSIKVTPAGITEIDFYDPVDSKDMAMTKKMHLSTDGITLFGATTSDTTLRISDSGYIHTFGGIGIDTTPPNANLHVVGRSEFTDIIRSEYAGPDTAGMDYIGVHGISEPTEGYGIGGEFKGGYRGVKGIVNAPGYWWDFMGVRGEVHGSLGIGYNYGVYGYADSGATNYGVYGWAGGGTTNWAGYFAGNCRVTGIFDNAKSGIVMDHPDDPANKYLYHSGVISPEMKTVYDGVAVLDSDGRAVVDLPGYFDRLNENFRYQLTCIGGYAPVYIADEISGNQFRIAGGQPGMKVSWQVTGVRSDAFAKANPMEVEKEKVGDERGKYLNPEAFGLDEQSGVDYETRKRSEGQADR